MIIRPKHIPINSILRTFEIVSYFFPRLYFFLYLLLLAVRAPLGCSGSAEDLVVPGVERTVE